MRTHTGPRLSLVVSLESILSHNHEDTGDPLGT